MTATPVGDGIDAALARVAASPAARRLRGEALILDAARAHRATNEQRAVLLCGDSIVPEAITWLWPGWLAAGKLHLLAGSPGTGKTTIALALAATITRGGCWPDGTRADRGSVVMWSGEDDAKDVLIPRLLAMDADVSRVHVVAGITGPEGRAPFDPARDVDLLAAALRDVPGVRLLIVDPIVSAVAGDSHKNAEVRRGLQPLVDLAVSHRCALFGITHLSKGTAGRDPVERLTGSLAFGALPRVVMLAARELADDGKPGRRLFMRAKSNIGPDSGGHGYDLCQGEVPGHPGIVTSSVTWGAAVEGTARELLAEAEQVDDDRTAGTDAADFLRELLADGPMLAKDVYRDADGAGFSKTALHRARHKLGIVTRKQGMSAGWVWRLPNAEDSTEDSEGVSLRESHSSESSAQSSGDEVRL